MMPAPDDFYDLDALLTPLQRQVRSSVRDFVMKQVEPGIRQSYRDESFPEHLPRAMGEMGLLGPTLKGHGLSGLDPISYGLMMRELERCDSGLRSFASVQGALVMYPIHAFGTEEQKQAWLGPLSRGEAIGCFGLTEPQGGSDPAAMRTRAQNRDGGWILNGSKMWITNGSIAQIAIVWAQTENGVRGFLVPTETPGVKAVKIEGKLSLRASVTAELYFDDVVLPEGAVLPGTIGLRSALQCLGEARYSIAWGVLGAAEACFAEALRHAKQRILFKRSLASFQLLQEKLAIMCGEMTKGQLIAFRLGQLKENGTLDPAQISLAKQNNVRSALYVARTAREILGAYGIMDEYRSMRHLCNLESVYTYEGTNDIHLLVVGKELTGESAFS